MMPDSHSHQCCAVSASHLKIGHPKMKSTSDQSFDELNQIHVQGTQESTRVVSIMTARVTYPFNPLRPSDPHIYVNKLRHHWFR